MTVTPSVALAATIVGATLVAGSTIVAQQPNVQRRVLLQQDLTIPGQQAVLVEVTIPAGGREGRHTHPGTLLVHILEGTMTFEHEGRSIMSYKPGESFTAEPGKIHEGSNRGTTPVRAIATFVVEKGKPLTTQVP
jgi:quercetin dioxygenase-like cupin family protein